MTGRRPEAVFHLHFVAGKHVTICPLCTAPLETPRGVRQLKIKVDSHVLQEHPEYQPNYR